MYTPTCFHGEIRIISIISSFKKVPHLKLKPLTAQSIQWYHIESGHIWESQDLLKDGQVIFPGFSGFRPHCY